MFCMSRGLGCPGESILLGTKGFIDQAFGESLGEAVHAARSADIRDGQFDHYWMRGKETTLDHANAKAAAEAYKCSYLDPVAK